MNIFGNLYKSNRSRAINVSDYGEVFTTIPEEEAVHTKHAYTASTSPQPVIIGSVLAVVISNPLNSGVNMFIRNRSFGNDRGPSDVHLEYVSYIDPTAVLSNNFTVINRFIGSPSSVAALKWQTGTIASIGMGGSSAVGEVLPNGVLYERILDIILPPGKSFGYIITGAGSNLQQAARVSFTLDWHEEPIQY